MRKLTLYLKKEAGQFCSFEQIDRQASLNFERLRCQKHFVGRNQDEFIEKITDFYCVTNDLHPFRDGNGRALRAFVTQLVRYAGFDIDFADIDKDLLMIATIQSSGGITDTLRQIFGEIINTERT